MLRFDPTRWLVSWAGFAYDWILTREWSKVLLGLIPACLLLVVGGLVWAGKAQDREQLAQWYLELGDTESKDWENVLAREPAGSAEAGAAAEGVDGLEAGQSSAVNATDASTPRISSYADMLFRRAQLLAPNNRSQCMIALNLIQQGARARGQALLQKIAPPASDGFEPAHAFVAILMVDALRNRQLDWNQETVEELQHHIANGRQWQGAPLQFWFDSSEVTWELGRRFGRTDFREQSLELLKQAAARDPAVNLLLADRARQSGNASLQAEAVTLAQDVFEKRVEAEPRDDQARVQLAQTLMLQGDMAGAEQTLTAGMAIKPTAPLKRTLSNLWLSQSIVQEGDEIKVNAEMLEAAWQVDPSNPQVVEQIARMARIEGAHPGKELIEQLQQALVTGSATATTHAQLSEAYLSRGDFAKALPHLRQVIKRAKGSPRYLNNLAYTLWKLDAANLSEALHYSQLAVKSGMESGDPHVDDYWDTLGTLCSHAGKSEEAITAFENAIALNARFAKSVADIRLDYRERLAAEYRQTGNEEMAQLHEQEIARLEQQQAPSAN